MSVVPVSTMPRTKKTVPNLVANKGKRNITALTAYDATMARWLDRSGVDIILVGDSLGNVIQGQEDTLPVTLEEMIYHTRCVSRSVQDALVVGDLPFGTFQISVEETLRAAIRLVKEGGAQAIKLEGATPDILRSVEHLVASGIPVVGHVGLTPQSIHAMGGFRKQGKDADSARRIVDEAKALEAAGAFAVVVECVPHEVATTMRAALDHALVIGIGAGADCDGQILVTHDLLGMLDRSPSFAPRYAELALTAERAIREYVHDVQNNHQRQSA